MSLTQDSDEILIMGPAEAKIGLKKRMTKDNSFSPSVVGFESLDSVTENQKVAFVREFFRQQKPLK